MTNYRRASVPGGVYFFTVVTHDRQPILTTPLARASLRQAIREVRSRRPFDIEAIVLLPDHLHAVWTLPPGDIDFSTRWRQIKTLFTKRWIASGGAEGEQSTSRLDKQEHAVWQRRFYEHCCRDEEDASRCIDYVHVNPLKHGLVKRVVEWPWSSFHRYVRLGIYADAWGSSAEWRRDGFRRFE